MGVNAAALQLLQSGHCQHTWRVTGRVTCVIWLRERAFNSSSMVCCIIILKIPNIKELIQCSNESCIFEWFSRSILISVFEYTAQYSRVFLVSTFWGLQCYNGDSWTSGNGQWSMQLILEQASWARQAPGFNAGTNTDHLQNDLNRNIVCTFSSLQCKE